MPIEGVAEMAWFSPDPRGIIAARRVRARAARCGARRGASPSPPIGRSRDVVAGCADPRRPGGWITPAIRAAYGELHALGWAHSIEVWDADGALAGGLYGVEIGGLFAAESKFHAGPTRPRWRSLALVGAAARRRAAARMLDVQWTTPHLRSLGARDIPRAEYLRRLPAALDAPPAFS